MCILQIFTDIKGYIGASASSDTGNLLGASEYTTVNTASSDVAREMDGFNKAAYQKLYAPSVAKKAANDVAVEQDQQLKVTISHN